MMWTVGCVKNNFGWTDNRLMAKLTDLLLEEPLESLNRGGRLLVRILWTLTVHKDSIDSFACRRLGQKVLHMLDIGSRQDDLSTHHISTIILAGASLHVMREEAAEQLVDFFSQALARHCALAASQGHSCRRGPRGHGARRSRLWACHHRSPLRYRLPTGAAAQTALSFLLPTRAASPSSEPHTPDESSRMVDQIHKG